MGWLTDRQRDGGIDTIPLPSTVPGELRVCGKHAVAAARFADPTMPWSTVVCLNERGELADRYPAYVDWLDAHASGRDRAIWSPIPDLDAPPLAEMCALVDELVVRLHSGIDLLVHCGAGMGRAGTAAVCILVRLGLDLDLALAAVDGARTGAGPEAGPQRELVVALASSTARTT